MTQQRLRLLIAGLLALVALLGVILLAVVHDPVPAELQVVLVASVGFAFGTLTNGSSLGPPPAKP